MSLSKESKVAKKSPKALNSLEASNLSSAAGHQEWLRRLVSDCFESTCHPQMTVTAATAVTALWYLSCMDVSECNYSVSVFICKENPLQCV